MQAVPGRPRQYAASKVPVITAYFWIIKILSTAMGEATSDYLAHRYDPYIVVPLGGIALLITLAVQLRTRRYNTWIYWLTVVMVAVVGTMVADASHIQFGIPYYQTSAVFAITLICVFVAWQRTEGTLSIHSIYTVRREMFYWATVCATFALGTALGDLTAHTIGIGFLGAGVLFAVVFAVPAVAHWKFGMNPIAAFWFAYVVTRPLGASFADYFGMPRYLSGLGYGAGQVAVLLTIPIVVGMAYLAISRKDVEERMAPATVRGKHRAAHGQYPAAGQPAVQPLYSERRPDPREWLS